MEARAVFSIRALGLLVVLTSTASETGLGQATVATGFVDRTLRLDSTSYRYQVYLPTEFDPGRRWRGF